MRAGAHGPGSPTALAWEAARHAAELSAAALEALAAQPPAAAARARSKSRGKSASKSRSNSVRRTAEGAAKAGPSARADGGTASEDDSEVEQEGQHRPNLAAKKRAKSAGGKYVYKACFAECLLN